MLIDEDNIIESDIDRMMLESYGIDDCFVSDGMMNESLDRKPRLFGVDGFLVFDFDDTVNYILKDEIFNAVLEEFYDKSDSEGAFVIVGQWSSDFIKSNMEEFVLSLTKGEILKYDDFFREMSKKSENENLIMSIDSNDKRFDKMPKVVRIQ